jgi:hypothetical protein
MAFELEDDPEEVASEKELSAADFNQSSKFLKNKPVGETLTFEVVKVVRNENVTGTNKETKKEFNIGLKDRAGNIKRIDLHTKSGEVYTIGSWEIYFKLFDANKGLLIRYAAMHKDSFAGAKVSIQKNHSGNHATMDLNDLSKVIGKSLPEAKEYQQMIKNAIKEQQLFTVTVE